jgi:hypothetical protein
MCLIFNKIASLWLSVEYVIAGAGINILLLAWQQRAPILLLLQQKHRQTGWYAICCQQALQIHT